MEKINVEEVKKHESLQRKTVFSFLISRTEELLSMILQQKLQ